MAEKTASSSGANIKYRCWAAMASKKKMTAAARPFLELLEDGPHVGVKGVGGDGQQSARHADAPMQWQLPGQIWRHVKKPTQRESPPAIPGKKR